MSHTRESDFDMSTAMNAALRAQVEEMRPSVLTDPRRADAMALFRRIYGVPETSVMDHFAEHGRTLLRADSAVCGLLDGDRVRWHGTAHCVAPRGLLRSHILVEWAAIAGTPLLFDDTAPFPVDFSDVAALGWRAVAAMPLVVEGVAVGAILMGRVGGMPWTRADRDALRTWMATNAILNDRRAESLADAATSSIAANARFGTIFERAPMGIVLVDHEGRYEAVNAAFAELAGISREEIVGMHVRDVAKPVSPDDPTAQYLEEMLAGKRRAYTVERMIRQPNGRERLVRVTTAQLKLGRNMQVSHLAVCEDVTDQREAERALRDREEQLRQAQKMEAIGQLAGGLAHDFSNALAAISGFASLLRDETQQDDPRRKDIDGILRVTQRASGITRKLLTMSKKQVQERATLDLCDVLQEFGLLVRPVLPATIRYKLVTPSTPVYATIDRAQIEQVLLNISLNARDAMPSGGTLTISLTPPQQAEAGNARVVRIAVADTGSGIAPDVLPRLWEPFFSTKSRGSGLGLPMSLAILREHGGELTAESPPGQGATFTLALPAAEAGVPTSVPINTAGVSLSAPPAGQTVLLAEDEEAVRVTSKRILERAGFTVLVADQGVEAWRLFLANIDSVDILVTDLTMPELTGRELVRRVRANVADLPVVITSAYSPDDDEGFPGDSAAEAVNATLVKPFSGSVLVQTIREVLSKHHRRDRPKPASHGRMAE